MDTQTIPTNLEQVTFVNACRKFFGPMPGQTIKAFADEIKAVQGKDREDLIQLFRSVGYDATKVA